MRKTIVAIFEKSGEFGCVAIDCGVPVTNRDDRTNLCGTFDSRNQKNPKICCRDEIDEALEYFSSAIKKSLSNGWHLIYSGPRRNG